jgi:hypothetical protein
MIQQMDPRGQNPRYDLIFINQTMHLVNQAMSKAFGVYYEPPQLDDSSDIYFE